jgi:hypothetical protein
MATYVEDIIQALKNLGGQAKLEQIYDEVNRIRTVPQTKNWKFNISGIIGNHCSDSTRFLGKEYFRKVDKGTYALSNQSGIKTPQVNAPIKVNRDYDLFSSSESFETISNILRTIQEYREYSNPASPSWIEYIQEIFHIMGFITEKQESRLLFLKDMGGNNTPKAIVGIPFSGENFEEIVPGMKWETHLLFAASHYQIEWGILTNGLQLKIFNFGGQGDQPPLLWPDLDGIIEYEKSDEFFKIYKVFSAIKGFKKGFDRGQDTRSRTKVIPDKPELRTKSPNWSTEVNGVQQFVESVLKKQFGDGFRKMGRSYMYESDSEIVYFQNSNVEKDQWWYRVLKNARQYLASSKKQTWLCLTNIPWKTVYIFPMKAVEEQARHSGWKRDELEITIYPQRSLWHQLKWNIEEYRHDFR